MRNAFVDELITLARERDHISLIVGDLGYSVVEPFAKEFPDRFINAGIAEQNMAGLAAGMASEGYHVFTYSIANFPTFRCAEQLRNDVDYHNLAVTTVSVGGGVAYGALGYSHHAIQDYALMRMMPNTLIAAPSDPTETKQSMRYLVNEHKGPSYLRLGKAGEPNIGSDIIDLQPGKAALVHGNASSQTVVISTGKGIKQALDYYKNFNIAFPDSPASIYTMPLWGFRHRQRFVESFSMKEKIITFEDHLIDGGFGSWVLESLVDNNVNVEVRGLSQDVIGSVASENSLLLTVNSQIKS